MPKSEYLKNVAKLLEEYVPPPDAAKRNDEIVPDMMYLEIIFNNKKYKISLYGGSI
jgi:hypothetical protein